MSSLLVYLALIFLTFKLAFTYTDLFAESSDFDDITASFFFTSNDQESILGDDLSFNSENASTDLDLFTSDLNEQLLNTNLLSSCSDDNNGQPSKLRVRDACQANPNAAIKLPDISEDLKEADGPNRQFVWVIDVEGVRMAADEPEYYCVPHRPLYSKPVCGSGKLSDRWFGRRPLYTQLDNCKLSKSYIQPPTNPLFKILPWTDKLRTRELNPNSSPSPEFSLALPRIRVLLLSRLDPLSRSLTFSSFFFLLSLSFFSLPIV